jgi:hypothetical protein
LDSLTEEVLTLSDKNGSIPLVFGSSKHRHSDSGSLNHTDGFVGIGKGNASLVNLQAQNMDTNSPIPWLITLPWKFYIYSNMKQYYKYVRVGSQLGESLTLA